MQGTLGDLWLFNTATRTWIAPLAEGTPPCPREMHSGTMVSDGRLLVYGGRSAAGQVPDSRPPGQPALMHEGFSREHAGQWLYRLGHACWLPFQCGLHTLHLRTSHTMCYFCLGQQVHLHCMTPECMQPCRCCATWPCLMETR